MKDPIRWSEASGVAESSERTLVCAGQDLPMPGEIKQATWSQILAILPPALPAPSPTQAAVASSGSLLALKTLKAICLLAAASTLFAGGFHWLSRLKTTATHDIAPAPAPSVATSPVQSAVAIPQAAPPIGLPTATPDTAAVSARTAALSHSSQLREESLAVMSARQALRANQVATALQLLEQAQQRFKKGALQEERESLSIEALAKSGQRERASVRARAFIRQYPRSPHVADVQRYTK